MLTHATENNPAPSCLSWRSRQISRAMFRRAAINAALGSARSFFSSPQKWRASEKQTGRGKGKKPFTERPPVPPRTWNKSAPFYAGQWKDRMSMSIMLKVWTGTCWSWIKVRTPGPGVARLTLSWAVPSSFAVANSGGCILPSKRPSPRPLKSRTNHHQRKP